MADVQSNFALIEQLEREHEDVERAIDELMTEMAMVPADQRFDSDWGPAGAKTKRFLELSERQNELLADIKRVSLAIEAAAPSKTAN